VALAALDEVLAGPVGSGPAAPSPAELQEKAQQLLPRFKEAMDDDFNTAQALGVIFDLVRTLNRYLAEAGTPDQAGRQTLAAIRNAFAEIGQVLGLFRSVPAQWLAAREADKAGQLTITPAEIEALIAERTQARMDKDFKRSDEIRDQLLANNIQLLDTPQGTSWKVK